MKRQVAERLRQIANAHSKALRLIGETVDYARDEVIDEALTCLLEGKEVFLLGVKNTSAIPRQYIEMLKTNAYLFHTLDNISEQGRAIYTGVRNPLTGMSMTGSSATTASHVLRNINQVGIGTDGGGSVLAPALACGLYAVMGKGLGLVGNGERVSTDGIAFLPGIGILAQEYAPCRQAIQILLGANPFIKEEKDPAEQGEHRQKIAVVVWEGQDDAWHQSLAKKLPQYSFEIFRHVQTTNRQELMEIYHRLSHEAEFILSKEGPIDLYGPGDSIIGSFGESGSLLQNKGQKYFVKIANLVDATAVAIPCEELGSGYLLLAKSGQENGLAAIRIGAALAREIRRPKIFEDYFFQSQTGKGFL